MDVRGTFSPSAPPVVLVHGIGMSGEYFLPFADELSAHYDVYVLDLPGYGTTPTPDRALSVPELAEVLAEVIDALGVAAPVVIGHSMGCQVVANALAAHPDLCRGYMLIGPTVDPAARSRRALFWRLLRDTLRELPSTNLVVFRNYVRMGLLRYLATLRSMLADRLEDTITRCTAPGAVVRGTRDPIAPRSWAARLAGAAPQARLIEVPGAPHALQHHRPRDLAAACVPVLSSVFGEPPGAATDRSGA